MELRGSMRGGLVWRLAVGAYHVIDELRPLVNRCLAGDQAAMRQLVDRFRAPVVGLCYRMLGHLQDAEDAAQETFIRLLKSLRNWDSARDFEPWLLAIAGNRCRTFLATRRRKYTIQPYFEDSATSVDERDDLSEEINLALQSIRPEHRQAFLMFHQQELSYEQIAEALSCPIGTVKTWIHRARRRIIDHLRAREVIETRNPKSAKHPEFAEHPE